MLTAGVTVVEARRRCLSMTLETWNSSLRRNLDSASLVSKAALPTMVGQGWGRIVMVASVTGPLMAMKGDVAYGTAKAGMVGLMRALALDAAGRGVTVNAVLPGWIATSSQTEREEREGQLTPLGRSGTPDEVAAAIAWLELAWLVVRHRSVPRGRRR